MFGKKLCANNKNSRAMFNSYTFFFKNKCECSRVFLEKTRWKWCHILPIKKPSVQITFKEINLSAGLYLHIQKKSNKENLSWKKNVMLMLFFSVKMSICVRKNYSSEGSSTNWNWIFGYMESTRIKFEHKAFLSFLAYVNGFLVCLVCYIPWKILKNDKIWQDRKKSLDLNFSI